MLTVFCVFISSLNAYLYTYLYIGFIEYRIKPAVNVIGVKNCIYNEVKMIIDLRHDILKRLQMLLELFNNISIALSRFCTPVSI